MTQTEPFHAPDAFASRSREPVPRRAGGVSSWLLRASAVVAFLAALLGVLVAPGLRGLADDPVVDVVNRLAWTLAYWMSALLLTLIVFGELTASRAAPIPSLWKKLVISAPGLAVVLAAPALIRPLPTVVAALLAVVTSLTVIAGALQGVRARHTRAVGAVMLAFGICGLLRVVGWDLARVAGDSGNTGLYATARLVVTVALGFEAVGQMVAAAWLGTRSRLGGQLLSSVAIGLAWVITFSAAKGANGSSNGWQAAAHIALASASGLPHAYGPSGLAAFLLAASVLLAGVAAVQRGQVVAVVAALSLSLIGRGAFDVPLHALAAAAGALWLTLAASDERALWQSLLAGREFPPPRRAGHAVSPSELEPAGAAQAGVDASPKTPED